MLSMRRDKPKSTMRMSPRGLALIQMHHIVPMQEGHARQDLLGQPDHVVLREGLVVVGYALVEDLAAGGAGRKAQEGEN
ncbi:hypothetical protein EYF80_049040 [Liparis tanakae]|uniref:Uncharacterized protein n=1 Tax=Liparis tanakae TaxID=230148 RepID=A0A4Z2FIQ1_9TELE|nr:hypothetical protein EYF80_049040 [Liparis tanakae]